MEDKRLQLKDGRTLAYTEQGDLSGYPVLFIHGNPGSRFSPHPDEDIARRLDARVIAPDRPGYGLSDYQPNRTLLDFPDDIAQLADALDIQEFAVFGVSAGGPYVAACAYKMSQRVTEAAIVSGVSPVDREGAFEGMDEAWRAAYQLSEQLPPWLLRPLLWFQTRNVLRNPDQAVEDMIDILSESDAEILKRPRMREHFMTNRAEATRRGHKGWAREVKILVSPWGFPLEEIPVTTHLWYWEDDKAIPLQMGRYLEDKIPHTQAHFLPDGGHLSIYDHWDEIIKPLISH